MKASQFSGHSAQLHMLSAVASIVGKHVDAQGGDQVGQREMLRQVLDHLDDALDTEGSRVRLVSPESADLVVDSSRGAPINGARPDPHASGEDVTTQVLQSGQPVFLALSPDDCRLRGQPHRGAELSDAGLHTLCLPILLQGETLGALTLTCRCDDEPQRHQVQQVSGIVADMIATSVSAGRSYQQRNRMLEEENMRLRAALGEQLRPECIIGNSHAIRSVYENIRKVAPTDTTVLIRGEPGTGKELVASAIHYGSRRSGQPFVKVNCGSMSAGLLESELFGQAPGVFPAGPRMHCGRIEQAEGGTLFLDEIGDMSPALQVRLLRLIQDGEFERVAGHAPISADVRVLASSSRDLEVTVQEGDFRRDLYYRINIFPIFLPALRERKGDIQLLADHFVAKYANKMGDTAPRISTATLNMMLSYHWPGNVRELENCVEGALVQCEDGVIHGCHLPATLQSPSGTDKSSTCSLKTCISNLERDLIVDALKRCDGNISAASRQLGITARMTRYKIKNLKIDYRRLFKHGRSTGGISGLH